MDTPATVAPDIARPLGRSFVYRALAEAFRYPSDEALERLAASLEAITARDVPLDAGVEETLVDLAAAVGGASREGLREDYVAVFGHVVMDDCPLYETACGGGDAFRQPQTLADLQGFYRAFGVELAADAGERADHLAVELEFMHYLAYREAYALAHHGADAVALVRDAERQFLERHLGRWAPAVGRAVAARADGALGTAGRALEQVLVRELADHGVAPSEVTFEAPVHQEDAS